MGCAKRWGWWLLAGLLLAVGAQAQPLPRQVVDLPTRPGVTQRVLFLTPPAPRATFVLFSGGNGGLHLALDGSMAAGRGNFLIRSRQLFVDQGVAVAIVDAPSDRQSPPFLSGFRQTAEHTADIRAVIAWARERSPAPVWLVGTSRGTQSAAWVATALVGSDGPDGLVLTATILNDPRGRSVPDLPMDTLRLPVLVVHHEQDDCRLCSYADLPRLTDKLTATSRTELLSFRGGLDEGDPCEARAHHGFNGLETDVVGKIVAWTQQGLR